MPHFKCVPCKARLSSAGSGTDLVGDLCPGCGSLLEPVGEFSEVVGFRSITARDSAGDGASDTHQRIADRLEDFLACREAVLAQARLDAERWLDHSGSFRAEALALPRPETNA